MRTRAGHDSEAATTLAGAIRAELGLEELLAWAVAVRLLCLLHDAGYRLVDREEA